MRTESITNTAYMVLSDLLHLTNCMLILGLFRREDSATGTKRYSVMMTGVGQYTFVARADLQQVKPGCKYFYSCVLAGKLCSKPRVDGLADLRCIKHDSP